MKRFIVLAEGGVQLKVDADDFAIPSSGALEFFNDGFYTLAIAPNKWISVERVQDESIQK